MDLLSNVCPLDECCGWVGHYGPTFFLQGALEPYYHAPLSRPLLRPFSHALFPRPSLRACCGVQDPAKRLGTKLGAEEIKEHAFFAGMNWALLRNEAPPYIPLRQTNNAGA